MKDIYCFSLEAQVKKRVS